MKADEVATKALDGFVPCNAERALLAIATAGLSPQRSYVMAFVEVIAAGIECIAALCFQWICPNRYPVQPVETICPSGGFGTIDSWAYKEFIKDGPLSLEKQFIEVVLQAADLPTNWAELGET
ncbi:hypothetical protein Vadar_021602 [Vaccinium darrowii]|uniref:Uncharacterized protein n=1 Tax=Vaccinium darrowii TaxID=229202 RepID=A0ACB7YPP2_9ERIC|nr:hypothetical protein Vadar_021602 [Vaccinium darrowii]